VDWLLLRDVELEDDVLLDRDADSDDDAETDVDWLLEPLLLRDDEVDDDAEVLALWLRLLLADDDGDELPEFDNDDDGERDADDDCDDDREDDSDDDRDDDSDREDDSDDDTDVETDDDAEDESDAEREAHSCRVPHAGIISACCASNVTSRLVNEKEVEGKSPLVTQSLLIVYAGVGATSMLVPASQALMTFVRVHSRRRSSGGLWTPPP
jgi:hypothetical protein